MKAVERNYWPSLVSNSAAAVIVGFASTILVVMEGVRAVGANAAQQASTAAILCLAMTVTSLVLAVRYKQPIMVAWSTPGSALLATSAAGTAFPDAIGAFMVAGALVVVTALIKPVSQTINRMPAAIAAAMLAGVLLRYVMGVPGAAIASPMLVVPLVVAFFVLRMLWPIFTVPVIVAAGMVMAAASGAFSQPVTLGITPLTFDWPSWNLQAVIGLGLPLYLVTMASQNLPGFAVLRANGYEPPVAPCLLVTGVGSILAAPFGSHQINMAAITAAMVAGADTHPDPGQRWKMVYPYAVLYVIVGLAAGTFVLLLGAMPKDLVTAIAGLALFGPLMGGLVSMVKEPKDVEAALVTFLVTASGISLLGVGSAFWGLFAGLIIWGVKRLLAKAN